MRTTARKRIRSGWCETGRCARCAYVLQTATARRRTVRCACTCHTSPRLHKKCSTCSDTGWIAAEDPILGGLIDNRCPDCWP